MTEALKQRILQGDATPAQRLMYADWLEENGGQVRCGIIRQMVAAEEAFSKCNWMPERRPINDGYAWWNRAELDSDQASHLPPAVFHSLMIGMFGSIGCYYESEAAAQQGLERGYLRAWLHGWRPADVDA